MSKKQKAKAINYEILSRKDCPASYEMLADITDKHHEHLSEAKIALAWRKTTNSDADGKLLLGRCKKCSDLEREAHGFDFIIVLNKEFWHDKETTDAKRRALLDHEVTHAQVSRDEEGEEKRDEFGRKVYRIRKHDIEEFREIVERHGLWKGDLEAFARSCREKRAAPLLAEKP